MILKVLRTTDSRLRTKSIPVKKVDKKIKALISDMKDTLNAQKDPEGVGLAAPQVGKNLQIFLIDYENNKKVIINPKVLKVSKIKTASVKASADKQIVEGCLSLPNYYGPIERSKLIKLEYLDEEGKPQVEKFKGFLAQIVQHELDHLNGILFIDRILEQKKPLYKVHGNDWEEVELV